MTKLVLALALAFATLAAVPASAGPYCQEDLGYGRTTASAAAVKSGCSVRPSGDERLGRQGPDGWI